MAVSKQTPPGPPPPKAKPGRGGWRPGAGRKPAPGESFEAARRRKESALASLRELELAKRRGEFVEAAAATRAKADENRRLRSRLLAAPSRVRARCPHLTEQDIAAVDREIRDALTELADAVEGEA